VQELSLGLDTSQLFPWKLNQRSGNVKECKWAKYHLHEVRVMIFFLEIPSFFTDPELFCGKCVDVDGLALEQKVE